MKDHMKEIHTICIDKNLPFVTYRLPRTDTCTTFIQTAGKNIEWKSIHDISEKRGFIMAPFDTRNGKKYLMVKPDIVCQGGQISEQDLDKLYSIAPNVSEEWNVDEPVIIEKEAYITQVKTIKKCISKGEFQKTVLSRIKRVEGNYFSLITEIFRRTCESHPNAFVYIFKSDSHFWLGASPEPLIRLSGGKISTVSLAGTRPANENNLELSNWTIKEVLEQEYVTRYIHDVLREFKIRDYRVTSPYVKKAGDLVHLRTDFSFKYDKVADRIWEFLDALHPTPAVAGQPKEDAITYLKKLEPHDREYYAGFLGPVESNELIDLFVNLRCMKITPEYLSLYIGGGITLESDPEDEWEETQLKARSLSSILESLSWQTDDKVTLQTAGR
ncbi:chorismate-binding protein [Bacteroidota bacterium]